MSSAYSTKLQIRPPDAPFPVATFIIASDFPDVVSLVDNKSLGLSLYGLVNLEGSGRDATHQPAAEGKGGRLHSTSERFDPMGTSL